jgi:Putative Ig domain
MRRLILAALGAAVLLLSGCGGGVTAAPATGIKLSTNSFPNQLPSPCPLPNATAGTAYSVTITASGGFPPYTWALAPDSSLPAGLTLASGTPSATISGTPQQGGTFTFSLQVTDAGSPAVTASAEFSLTVSSSGLSLWVPNGPSVTVYSPTSLAMGGDVAPSVVISGSNTGLAGTQCAAFDSAGNLWITDFGSKLISQFPASSLSSGGNVTPTVTLKSSSVPDPVGCVFDSSGNLWVASFTCCVAGDPGVAVGRFSPAQLSAGGTDVTPAAVIEGDLTQLDSPKGVAIDSSGNLWVANNANVVCCSTVVEFSASEIAGSGALNIAPIAVIGGDLTGLNVTGGASGVTFDQAGNLWVASDVRPVPSVFEYSASALAVGGTLNIAPAVTLSGSGQMTGASGLVFDSAGNLWVATNSSSGLLEFSPAALSQGGSVAPTVVVSGPNSKLVAPFMPIFH